MSPPSKKIKKRCSFHVDIDEPQREDRHPSISSLPDEIVLNCLLNVPRSYYLNLSFISKTLSSLVRSPELYRLRSLHRKDSVYVSFRENDRPDTTYHWFTLCRNEKNEYRLVSVPIPFPSHLFMHRSSTVAVGSEIFFVGGSFEPSSDLWILDTRSGKLTQGPSMKVARTRETAVGVINGKVYVIGGCEDEIQVEVFDPVSRNWKLAESPEERLRGQPMMRRLSASLDRKLYMVEIGGMAVYDSRKGRRRRRRRMETLEMPNDTVWCMCVVGDVLYAYYFMCGLMWFDTERKEWRRVVGCGVNALDDVKFHAVVTAEYDGKLAIMWPAAVNEKKEIRCALIALDCVGKKIRGTIEWCGVVATMPGSYSLHNCLLVSH